MRKTPTQRMLERSTGRDTAELLRDLYVVRRHSQVEIGEALGISRGAVQQWLDQFGISRDERAAVSLEPTA